MSAAPDFVCYSHLRWDHVFQRPNHLMTRAARERRVFFVEEPVEGSRPGWALRDRGGVVLATPELPSDLAWSARPAAVRELLLELLAAEQIERPVGWYYTPMALSWSAEVDHAAVVYDCMDELSAFLGAPAALRAMERALLARADVVFTGGHSLYEAKRRLHRNVHPFPSSVDVAHFAQARRPQDDPVDQREIPHPRLGFFGVIDERMDLALLDAVARSRPSWQIVLVGPVAKIDRGAIPQLPNVHWLGAKPYEDLPRYLAGWDVALLPFALNEATRYISPTKTPEYLAGGRPVVSTPIRDVVEPWGRRRVVRIADGATAFAEAIDEALHDDMDEHRARADAALTGLSWDATWEQMRCRLDDAIAARAAREVAAAQVPAGKSLTASDEPLQVRS